MKNRRWLRRKLMSLRDSQPNPANNLPLVIIVSLAILFCTALPLSLNPQNVPSAPSLLPGQSATTLPDGKWLLVGGETSKGSLSTVSICFFFQAEDGIRNLTVTGVQTCALPI